MVGESYGLPEAAAELASLIAPLSVHRIPSDRHLSNPGPHRSCEQSLAALSNLILAAHASPTFKELSLPVSSHVDTRVRAESVGNFVVQVSIYSIIS